MALKIGFTNEYFTLWSVSTEEVYATAPNGQHYLSGIKTNYFYMQNLSKDEANAKRKAAELGCNDLDVDSDLYGRKGSWKKTQKFEFQYEAYMFRFGKYECMDIRESKDIKYLLWYAEEASCLVAMERVCELDSSYTLQNGRLISAQARIAQEIKSKFLNGKIELIACSNFSEYDELGPKRGRNIRFTFDAENDDQEQYLSNKKYGIKVFLSDDELSSLELNERYYSGYHYAVPAGMRSFKGTKFRNGGASPH
jgi:hypothetical protein